MSSRGSSFLPLTLTDVLDRVENWVIRCIELAAAFTVAAEIVVLSINVIARFVFKQPLVWGDALASSIFLWLAMFGSVVALHREEHMCTTAFVSRLPLSGQKYLRTLGLVLIALFSVTLSSPSIRYAFNQRFVEIPGLGIPDSFRAAAIPAGLVMMSLITLFKLCRQQSRELFFGVMVAILAAAAMYVFRDILTDIGNWNLLIFFGFLIFVCVIAGLPISFSFGLSTVAYISTVTFSPLTVLSGRLDEGQSSLILLAIPLFVLLGYLLVATGMAKALVTFLSALLGHVRGGMSYVLIGAMILVSGISGAKSADMAAIAPVLFPEMRRRGANEGELVSQLAACGAMAETIPPSLVLIIIGSVTGVSITALFGAGLIPGLVMAAALAILARLRSPATELRAKRASLGVVMRSLLVAFPALILPFLIRGAVAGGVATATEVSTIGIAYSVFIGTVIYRSLKAKDCYTMLVRTASLSGSILFIIGTATGMAWALTQANFSHALVAWMAAVPGGRTGFLLVSVGVFIVLGSILEGIPAMVLFGPLLFPVAKLLGVNEIHYAIVVILSMGLGLFAPPFGVGYYTACAVSNTDPSAGLKCIWPYLGILLIALFGIVAIPWLSIGSVR